MIDVVGTKRSAILGSLIVLNLTFAGLVNYFIIPQDSSSAQRLRAVRAEVNTIQSDIDKMQVEFEQLGLQQDDFEKLKASGFFKSQTRNEARVIFQAVQSESGVISAVASIKPGIIEDNPEAIKAKHKILASKIEFNIKALDDTSVYKYLMLLQKNFIGHLSVDSLEISRTGDLTPQVLRAVASGSNPDLINAKLVLTWRTMIPETQVISDQSLE